MKKLISSILVVLFIFITPISNINVCAKEENESTLSSIFKGPIIFTIKLILYPLGALGGAYVVCMGTDKIFNLEKDTSFNTIKSGIKIVYDTAKNGVNFGINKINSTFGAEDVD